MLTRKHVMCADLDPQGYAHMQDELQKLQAKLEASEQRVKELEVEVTRRGGTICGERRFSEALCNELREKLEVSEKCVKALEEALGKVRDYDCYKHPDADIIAIREAAIKESENCTACQHAKKAKWPPSGLCNEHYRTVTRAQERVSQMFSHKQTWGPREIARRALEEK